MPHYELCFRYVFFYLFGFSFTGTDGSQGSRGREGTILISHCHSHPLKNNDTLICRYTSEIIMNLFKIFWLKLPLHFIADVMLHVINLSDCEFEILSTITLVLQKHPLIKWSVGCKLLDWIKLFFLVFWLIITLRKLVMSFYFLPKT